MEIKTDDLLGPACRLYYDDPVHLVRGEGVWLYDAAGRNYLDMYNNVPRGGALARSVVNGLCNKGVLMGAIGPDRNIPKLRA